MIEPTETESKLELDAFIEAMPAIAREADENPELVKSAPHTTRINRIDEAGAAKKTRTALAENLTQQFVDGNQHLWKSEWGNGLTVF